MKRLSVLLLLLVLAYSGIAQSFYAARRDRTLIFSGGTGTSTYLGELSNPGDYIDAKPNLNVGLQYFVFNRLSIRGEVSWFQLTGSDAKAGDAGRVPRNLSFESNGVEASFTGALHLYPMGNRYYQRPGFNAYVFAGVGVMYSNPTAELNGVRYSLRPLMTEGVEYSRSQLVIPYGLGVKTKVGPFFNLALEVGYRKTFTDYLDDVSTVHVDKSNWTDPVRVALSDRSGEVFGSNIFTPGQIRGNPDSMDGYMLMNVKVEYYLPTNFFFKRSSSKRLYKSKRKKYRRR